MIHPQLGESLVQLTKNVGAALLRFARRRAIPLIVAVVMVLAAFQSYSVYQDFRRQDLTFLTGDQNGPSVEEARSIKKVMEAGSIVGKSYNLTLETTSGYEENRKRISADTEGNLVGFAYDGFGDAEDIAVVLPLDKRYLHILCRMDFLRNLEAKLREKQSENDTAEAATRTDAAANDSAPRVHYGDNVAREEQPSDLTLSRIYSALGDGKVYVGSEGSATRQLAEIVLRHFDRDPDKVRCHLSDLAEVGPALERGDIDMAFSSTLVGSSQIRDIAEDRECVLLGLNNHRDAIVQENSHLVSLDFQPNSYIHGPFCPERLQTIGARRVVICAQHMPTNDAYLVGVSTREAFRDRIPTIDWKTVPFGDEANREALLRYSMHPGAKLIQNDEQPAGPFQWTSVSLATIVFWFAAEVVRWLNSLFVTSRGRGEATGGERRDTVDHEVREPAVDADEQYSLLMRELENRIRELGRESGPLGRRDHQKWGRIIEDMRERILTANREGSLNQDQAHSLLVGLRKELTVEHDFRRPEREAGARRGASG